MAQNHTFKGTARAQLTVNGARHYVYHRTAVVIVNADNSIRLDSGGWRTATTRTAMNQASTQDDLGFRVFQRRGDWFVTWQGRELPFADQMLLTHVPAEVAA